jgi:hypothetical protein
MSEKLEESSGSPISTAQSKAAAAYRRKLAGALYLSHVSQEEIARQLKCDQSTISRDIKALKKTWEKEAIQEISDVVIRELAELNEMERQVTIEFGQKAEKNPRWILARLRIKEQKYMLLGLDKRVIELRGLVQLEDIEAIRQKRWEQVKPSLAEALFSEVISNTTVSKSSNPPSYNVKDKGDADDID